MVNPKTRITCKTSDHIEKWNEISASGVSVQRMQVLFDSSLHKIILGSFGAFPSFDNLLSRNCLIIERKGVKFGPWGRVFSVYRVLWQLTS